MPPTTLERSGSERRGGAVPPLSRGERVGVRGGALFNGKEGRGDFRKNPQWKIEILNGKLKSSMEN